MKPRTPLLAALLPVLLLGACGGGGGGADTPPTSQPQAVDPTASALTASGYASQRASTPATPSDVEVAKAAALSQSLAVADLLRSNTDSISTPSLAAAQWQLVAAAASSETASQINTLAPAGLLGSARGLLTRGLQREVFVQNGTRLLPEFWRATERQDGLASVASWHSQEVDFSKVVDGVPTNSFSSQYPLRTVIADRLTLTAAWPGASVEAGVFTTDVNARVAANVLRFTAGVRRYAQDDHQAEAMTVGKLTLLKLTPKSEGLSTFGPRRLGSALKESVDALLSNSPTSLPAAGQMLLPVVALQNRGAGPDDPLEIGGALYNSGLLALDPMRANLKALDGAGGDFAQSLTRPTQFNIDANGLGLNANQWLGFEFNPNNPNGPGSSGSGSTVIRLPPFPLPGPCPSGPQLRSFYLVLLDADRVVQALIAVGTASGSFCN